MPKPYDVTTKDILKRDPPSWMDYLHLDPGGPVQAIREYWLVRARKKGDTHRFR